jgi:hypothetical protein
MNKEHIRQAIISELDAQLKLASKAADEARDLATHEQSQPETQYDTVGLEASYLAHGQSQRVFELQETLQLYRKLPFLSFSSDDEISLTAYVVLEHESGDISRFFLGPRAGGLSLSLDQKQVLVITPEAPVTQCLLKLCEGDEVTLPGSDQPAEIVLVE